MRKLGPLVRMILAAAFLLPCGCGEENAQPHSPGEDGPLRVVVSIPPLAWAARELAPAGAEVVLLMEGGQSPHGFELTPSHVRALADADVVVLAGFGMEWGIEGVLADHPRENRRVVRLSDSVESPLSIACDHDHHHDDHDHAHAGLDPHAWLDPLVMGEFVAVLAGVFAVDSTAAQAACGEVHESYEAALAGLRSRRIVTHHNAYSYLSRRYGLEVAAVIQPIESIEPTPGDVRAAVDAIRLQGVGAIFVEPQFSGRAAERIAQVTGVRVLMLDPLGDGDWPAMMLANLESLVEGLNAARPAVE